MLFLVLFFYFFCSVCRVQEVSREGRDGWVPFVCCVVLGRRFCDVWLEKETMRRITTTYTIYIYFHTYIRECRWLCPSLFGGLLKYLKLYTRVSYHTATDGCCHAV